VTTDQGRAHVVRRLQEDVARPQFPVRALVCRPEYVQEVREIIEEAGVDIPIVTDPEAFGFFQSLRGDQFKERYLEQARE
jgi:hypothetical protein